LSNVSNLLVFSVFSEMTEIVLRSSTALAEMSTNYISRDNNLSILPAVSLDGRICLFENELNQTTSSL